MVHSFQGAATSSLMTLHSPSRVSFHHFSSYKPTLLQLRRSTSLNTDDDDDDEEETLTEEEVLENTPSVIGLPNTRQLLVYIFTTILVWTTEPLLSLVDSACVGRYAGRTAMFAGSSSNLASVVQLAALGPATMLCDSSIYLTYFIGLAATNKLARAAAKKDWKAKIETSSYGLGVSVALGLIVSILLFIFGDPLLRSIIGQGGAVFVDAATKKSVDMTDQVLHLAVGYTRIRTVSSIFAIMGSTAQSLLLCKLVVGRCINSLRPFFMRYSPSCVSPPPHSGVLDTPTVTLAVLVATILNTVGDIYLVAFKGWGVWGAAFATSAASVAANMLLIWKEHSLVELWRNALWVEKYGVDKDVPLSRKGKELAKKSKDTIKREREEYKEYLAAPFISLPDRKSLGSLFLIAAPIFFVMVAKLVEYWSMTVRVGNFGMISMACHNVLMRIFFFFATIGDGFSQSSQTFLPGLFVKKKKKKQTTTIADATKQSVSNPTSSLSKSIGKIPSEASKSRSEKAFGVIRKLTSISLVIGAFSSITARFIARNAGSAFTSDNQLVSLMSTASNYMGAVLLFHPLSEMLEGAMIASRDLRFLVCTQGVAALLFITTLRFTCTQITDIWKTMFVFQAARIALFGTRVWLRTKGKATALKG